MRFSSPKSLSLLRASPKDAGESSPCSIYFFIFIALAFRIVEFASPEDAQRAIRELSEQPLLGRPVFIREVGFDFVQEDQILSAMLCQDREQESRFGATPVPGKIGMAMAGQGLHAAPPPRPPSHNFFGQGNNPGNQLYVGNVRLLIFSCSPVVTLLLLVAVPSRLAGSEGFIPVSWQHHPCRHQYRSRWSPQGFRDSHL